MPQETWISALMQDLVEGSVWLVIVSVGTFLGWLYTRSERRAEEVRALNVRVTALEANRITEPQARQIFVTELKPVMTLINDLRRDVAKDHEPVVEALERLRADLAEYSKALVDMQVVMAENGMPVKRR